MFIIFRHICVLLLLLTVGGAVYSEEIKLERTAKFVYQGEEIEVSTDFDNGGLSRIEEVETNVFDCWPYEEEEYKNGWIYIKSLNRDAYDHTGFCFNFRINGCMNKKIKFNFHIKERQNDGDDSVVYFNPDFPVISYDGDTWDRMPNKTLTENPAENGWKIISVENIFKEDTAYIAYSYPYTNNNLDRLIKRIEDSPFCLIETAGYSSEGREIKLISITDTQISLEEKKVVWCIGLQHCTEFGAGWGLEGMIEFLISENPAAKEAVEKLLFKFIPIVNVDAVSQGRGRIHSSGKNLNREWAKEEPVPEIASIKKTMDDWVKNGNPIDIFIDFHGFSSKEDGKWWLFYLPEGTYPGNQADEQRRLIKTLEKHIPSISSFPKNALELGLARGAGYYDYNAISIAFDGFVYPFTAKWEPPDLSNHYNDGDVILPLESVKACGSNFIEAILEFSRELEEKNKNHKLFANYPNPFKTETTISFQVLSPSRISIKVYSITGQLLITLKEEFFEEGNYNFTWDGRDSDNRISNSGMYIVEIQNEGFNSANKILLLK